MSKHIAGLTENEAKALLEKHGKNILVPQKEESFVKKLFKIIKIVVDKAL